MTKLPIERGGKTIKRKLIAILLLGGMALGADLPDAPSATASRRVADKDFWMLTGVTFAANIADAVTTQQSLARGCQEGNPVLGPNPSGAVLWSYSLGIAGAAAGGTYVLKRWMPDKPVLRQMWRVPAALLVGSRTRDAIHNATISCAAR